MWKVRMIDYASMHARVPFFLMVFGRFFKHISRNEIEQLIKNRRVVSHGSILFSLLACDEPNYEGALSSRLEFQMFTGQ